MFSKLTATAKRIFDLAIGSNKLATIDDVNKVIDMANVLAKNNQLALSSFYTLNDVNGAIAPRVVSAEIGCPCVGPSNTECSNFYTCGKPAISAERTLGSITITITQPETGVPVTTQLRVGNLNETGIVKVNKLSETTYVLSIVNLAGESALNFEDTLIELITFYDTTKL
jgi:hypothetical protein